MIIWTFPIPAHGGTDPGTIANGITEKDYTLKISQYIQKRLDDLGIENSMTRTTDETLGPSVRPRRAQSFYGNGKDVIVLSNHINAGGGDSQSVTKHVTIKPKFNNKLIILYTSTINWIVNTFLMI